MWSLGFAALIGLLCFLCVVDWDVEMSGRFWVGFWDVLLVFGRENNCKMMNTTAAYSLAQRFQLGMLECLTPKTHSLKTLEEGDFLPELLFHEMLFTFSVGPVGCLGVTYFLSG